MPKVVPLTGPVTLNPSDVGTKKKWKFRNDTGEPIYDFFLKTGPESFLEIELPWGESGNPPDMRKFTIREEGFEDGSKEFDDETEGKATLDPPVDPGKEFEIEMEFDDPFEPKEYLQIIPTDGNGVTIEDDDQTETAEPNTGVGELLDAVGKAVGALGQLNLKLDKDAAALKFDKKKNRYVLTLVKAPARKKRIQVIHIKRNYLKRKANYGLNSKRP